MNTEQTLRQFTTENQDNALAESCSLRRKIARKQPVYGRYYPKR
ncbi:hypothetical protein [Tatumella sp. UBA2305]|nr:hypothetical protein [Tatumella sp. UBA2305]